MIYIYHILTRTSTIFPWFSYGLAIFDHPFHGRIPRFEGDDTGVEMMRPEADESMNTLTADVAAAGRAKTRGNMVGLWGCHPENMGKIVVLWGFHLENLGKHGGFMGFEARTMVKHRDMMQFDDDYDDLKCGKSMKE